MEFRGLEATQNPIQCYKTTHTHQHSSLLNTPKVGILPKIACPETDT